MGKGFFSWQLFGCSVVQLAVIMAVAYSPYVRQARLAAFWLLACGCFCFEDDTAFSSAKFVILLRVYAL